MTKCDSDDRHLDPRSGVLINLLGIVDQAELYEVESHWPSTSSTFRRCPSRPTARISRIYWRSTGSCSAIFLPGPERAGTARNVDISRGGNRFANWRFIEQEGARLAAELASEHWLAGLPSDRFAERMVWYMGELNVLHPFRDGNGRALREYMRYLAERATWPGVPPDEMLSASIATYRGDTSPLAALLLRQTEAAGRDD